MALPSVLDAAHQFAAKGVQEGGIAVDATVGNGHDTVFLLRQVGANGRVVGFDVQAEALDATRERIRATVPSAVDQLRLIRAGHETLTDHLPREDHGRVGTVMFNLGYLPGGDHSITTTPETTRQGLQESAEVLRPEGIITVVLYPGHEGGAQEARAVEEWAASLPQDSFQALSYEFINQVNDPPRLLVIRKRSAPSGSRSNSP